MNMRLFLLLFVLLMFFELRGQSKAIPGVIIDSQTEEPIIFAKIFDASNKILYQTDVNGQFLININPEEEIDLYINYTGYPKIIFRVTFTSDTIVIPLITPIAGGYQDVISAKLYYIENKRKLDSLDHLYYQFEHEIDLILSNKN